jgi:hypothetical protein
VRYRALLSFLLFVLLPLGQARSQQETPAQKESKETQNVPSVTRTQPDAQEQKRQPDGSCKIPPLTDPFWSNWALVIVGVVTAWIALGTLSDLKKQTAATKIAAEAAKKSSEIAEVSLKLVERADVLLDSVALVHGKVLSGKDSRVVLQFRNFGHTQAAKVRLKLNLIVEGVPDTDSTSIPVVSIGAGDIQTVSSQRFVQFLTETTAQQIFSATIALTFEGEAVYEDIFGSPHRSYYTGTWDRGADVFHINKQESS